VNQLSNSILCSGSAEGNLVQVKRTNVLHDCVLSTWLNMASAWDVLDLPDPMVGGLILSLPEGMLLAGRGRRS
jgi:hypothetical protein